MIHVANMPYCSSVAHLRPERRQNPFLAHRVRVDGLQPAVPFQGPSEQAEQAGLYTGYYMRCANGANYWIGSLLDEAKANVHRAADLFLSPTFGHDYDLEYSFGCVLGGSSVWANLSAADRFF